MAAYTPILPPASVGLSDVLRPIRDLSASGFGALLTAVSGPRSFSLTKQELDHLHKQLSIEVTKLTFLLAALSYVHTHISRDIDAGIDYADAITAFVTELEQHDAAWGANKDDVKERFSSLL